MFGFYFRKFFEKANNIVLGEDQKELSPIDLAAQTFKRLEKPKRSVYRDIRPIAVLFSNIKLYESSLRSAIFGFENKRLITLSSIEVSEITHAEFYIDIENNPIDIEHYHVLFCSSAVKFLERYALELENTDPTPLQEENMRRVLVLSNNLIELANTLELYH